MKIAHHTFEYIFLNTSNPDVASMQISFQVDEVAELHQVLVKLWSYCIARVTNVCEPGAPSWTIDFTLVSTDMVSVVSKLLDKIGIAVHIDGKNSPRGPLSTFASCISGPTFTHSIQFSVKGVSTMNCNASSRINAGAVFS
jgi:hypothetical protein